IAVFLASAHPPNVEAAQVIVDLAPRLPRVAFLLAGSHTARLSPVTVSNVACLGHLDDAALASLLSVADVALNPMGSGAGTTLKVATYLAAGLPLVTTPFGARGYGIGDGEHALLAPLERFREGILGVLEDPALADRLASAGRRLAEERFDWKV